jgi:predicted phosphodiesterase
MYLYNTQLHLFCLEISVRLALISDIHGNLEALNAVLADIAKQDIDEIYCLGDVVGYGPNPCECLDLVMKKCKLTVLGNHDQAALFDPDGFNPVALRAIYWTRDRLDDPSTGRAQAINRRWDFLSELPKQYQDGDYLFVHGSPRDPTNEYVFPETRFDKSKMNSMFDRVGRVCFQGHTHMPGVFTTDLDFVRPEDCDHTFSLGKEKFMINVGSVGQPRDDNPLSCYVILDKTKKKIEFRRVEYDIETTISKIYAEAELDNMLGDRLRGGR